MIFSPNSFFSTLFDSTFKDLHVFQRFPSPQLRKIPAPPRMGPTVSHFAWSKLISHVAANKVLLLSQISHPGWVTNLKHILEYRPLQVTLKSSGSPGTWWALSGKRVTLDLGAVSSSRGLGVEIT